MSYLKVTSLSDSQEETSSATELTPAQAEKYLTLAKHAAQQAGKLQMDSFGKSIKIMTKNTGINLVTTVDRESDALICGLIRDAFPHDRILSEEQYQEGQTSVSLDKTWVIDPLDGTTNYAHGFPHFAVSIAYFMAGQPQLGVVYNPYTKELFYAMPGRGAFLNDTAIYTSSNRVHELAHALLATGFPYDIATSDVNNLDNFARLAKQCRGVRRPGAAALDLAYVASGRLDAFWELKLSLWDLAAGMLLIKEAGGKVTGLQGEPDLPLTDRHIHLISSNGTALHEEIQAGLQG
jgi:myo-inositol-1(or 4)-monophosphatase